MDVRCMEALDQDQVKEIRALVAAGQAANVSAFVQHAVSVALYDAAGWRDTLEEALQQKNVHGRTRFCLRPSRGEARRKGRLAERRLDLGRRWSDSIGPERSACNRIGRARAGAGDADHDTSDSAGASHSQSCQAGTAIAAGSTGRHGPDCAQRTRLHGCRPAAGANRHG